MNLFTVVDYFYSSFISDIRYREIICTISVSTFVHHFEWLSRFISAC